MQLHNEDGSATFEIENNLPTFEIRTKTGKVRLDVEGLRTQTGKKIETYPWKEKKKIARILATLAWNDSVYRKTAVDLCAGLKTAVSSTRGVEASLAPVSAGLGTLAQPINVAGPVEAAPGPLITGALEFGYCTSVGLGVSVTEDLISGGVKLAECTAEALVQTVEQCIDPIPDCLSQASQQRDSCFDDCNRMFRRWYNKWMRAPCKAGCWALFGIRAAGCLALALVCTVFEPAYAALQCLTGSSWVSDKSAQDCDIRLYEAPADAWKSKALDYATCGYGYSHAALVCGGEMVEAPQEGVTVSPLDKYGDRKFATVRLGLTDDQCMQLCKCARDIARRGADWDYMEAITFGTVDDPGREICSMLIMHCLDTIGFDRAAIGLGGFVSPNDIARRLGAPNGRLL